MITVELLDYSAVNTRLSEHDVRFTIDCDTPEETFWLIVAQGYKYPIRWQCGTELRTCPVKRIELFFDPRTGQKWAHIGSNLFTGPEWPAILEEMRKRLQEMLNAACGVWQSQRSKIHTPKGGWLEAAYAYQDHGTEPEWVSNEELVAA